MTDKQLGLLRTAFRNFAWLVRAPVELTKRYKNP
jgi:hypothetical protein